MPEIKGTDIVGLKKLLKSSDKQIEERFLSSLSNEDRDAFSRIVATSWTPVNIQANIYNAAAQALFPGRPDAVVQLHHKLAEQAYSGIYQIFLRIPSLQYIMQRVATLWKSYYSKGVAEVGNLTDNSLDFFVSDFPELPKVLREATTGHMAVILQKTGLKDVKVQHIASDPAKWQWHATWN